MIREHDVVVVPSLWECWPYAALEALHLNRPVLGTPVGGLAEIIKPGDSGWLAAGTGSDALERGLEQLLERRAELESIVRARRSAHARARELCDEGEILDGYQELARQSGRGGGGASRGRVVGRWCRWSFRISGRRRLWRTRCGRCWTQSYPRFEIVLVNDGSFEDEDWVVAELAARAPVVVVSQMNSGLGAARNFGISQCRGRYVLPLDADNIGAP